MSRYMAGWTGTDTFTYTIKDPKGLTDTATVSIAVLYHYDGDECDHDSGSGSHHWGDRDEHDRDCD